MAHLEACKEGYHQATGNICIQNVHMTTEWIMINIMVTIAAIIIIAIAVKYEII